jgi:hypothetical protein
MLLNMNHIALDDGWMDQKIMVWMNQKKMVWMN